MKRQCNLFDPIIDFNNIRLAFLKAIRGKRASSSVLLFTRALDANLEAARSRLSSLGPAWGDYRSFRISDPKPRTISAASVPERIMHHALMNVLEPVFDRQNVYHSYACRTGKGTHAAVRLAFSQCKARQWFLKLDVRRYFDSIDHGVLKDQLGRIIKDQRVLYLLFKLVDSYCVVPGKGLPIGNLTSQYFANLYLSGLDHHILEHLHPAAYVRYMDDMVLWDDDGTHLKSVLAGVQEFASNKLKLELKEPVLSQTRHGLPFLGFLIKPGGIYLQRKSRRRMQKRAAAIQAALLAGAITEGKAAQRAICVNAAVLLARTRSFRLRLWQGSGLGYEQDPSRRRLEQRREQRPRWQPEQQQPEQRQQQQRLPYCAPLSPTVAPEQPRNRYAPCDPAVSGFPV